MHHQELEELQAKAQKLSKEIPELQFLVLFGSRARGEETEWSDWDFAMMLSQSEEASQVENFFSAYAKRLTLLEEVFHLREDEIDLIELNRCSDLTAHFISRDGKLLYEQKEGEFEEFRKKNLKSPQELKDYRMKQRAYVSSFLESWGV